MTTEIASKTDNEISSIPKNDPKRMRAWAWYDWANSAFQLTITSTMFPIYYNAVTSQNNNIVDFFGWKVYNSALYSYTIAFGFLFTAILSPLLSGIADYTGRKKLFMRFFTLLGAFACIAMYYFDTNTVEFGVIAFALSIIGYAGSLVFYNSFIPEIVTPDKMDKLSAMGYSYGYIGSVILLIINLLMIFFHDFFHLTEKDALRVSFISVGIWWIGFSTITFKYLPKRTVFRSFSKKIVFNGFKELISVFKEFWQKRDMKIYLIAFFIYSTGVQSIMYLAVLFGTQEIKVPDDHLIFIVLLLQLIAIPGALLFSYSSKKIGNVKTLIIAVIIWALIVIGAFFTKTELEFFILALFVGILMGGTQSLSRSTYSKLIPKTKNTASYFSFYEFLEKISIVLGTASFGFFMNLTKNMRISIMLLLIYFIISLFFLYPIRKNPLLQGYE